MALNLYRRHYRIAGKCLANHLPDSRSYEPDELRRGWRKCHCPIYACGTLGGTFKRRNTEHWSWDEAKAVASVWESFESWDGKPERPPLLRLCPTRVRMNGIGPSCAAI